MKQITIAIFISIFTLVLLSQPVLAGGDKVRGDNGTGEVVQNGPCPFGADTPPVGP